MPARRRVWDDAIVNEDTATGTQDSTDLMPNFQESETKGFTLVRLIIGLDLTPNPPGVSTSADQMLMHLGIGVFSREMIDVVDFPEPQLSNNIPMTGWLWRATYVVAENVQVKNVRIDLDLRSQRRLMYGVPFMVMNAVLHNGVAFNVATTGMVRSLYLLP